MTHLLDTSAWLAHLFGESGVEEINLIFADPQNEVFVSALSLLEVYGRLRSLDKQEMFPQTQETYAALFSKVLPVDESVAQTAIDLRTNTQTRLPTIYALIAATAVAHDLTLVHRDPHLAAITNARLRQMTLPDK